MLHTRWPIPRVAFAVALLSVAASAAPAAVPQVQDRYAIPASDDGLPGAGPIRRYEWFQRLWSERRSAWAGTLAQDRGAVLCQVFPSSSSKKRPADQLRALNALYLAAVKNDPGCQYDN